MVMLKKRNLLFLIIVALLVGVLSSGVVFYFVSTEVANNSISVTKNEYEKLVEVNKKYAKLEDLYKYVSDNYYVPVKDEDLEVGIYKGLLYGTGDPYSNYLTAEEYDEMMISTSGEYDGIGVTIAGGTDGYITIVAPMDGGPAYDAGIKAGDKIISIDGKKYDSGALDDAAVAMRGKSGTKVKLIVSRDSKSLTFDLVRTKIIRETVTSKMLDNNIGLIRISAFEENTAKDFETELRQMEIDGVKGLVIDLRNNGGGLVQSGTKIADLLLPSGTISYTEDRKGKRETFKSDASYTDLPYVVLINGGTASTSEIVSAAIKDHKTGKLIGTKTFGKGIIQSVNQLDDGDAIKLTIMQYFSPDGNVIDKVGIKPDIEVELTGDDKVDEQLERALKVLNP